MGRLLRSLFFDYGMLGVLILLCLVCSLATIARQQPLDWWTADALAAKIADQHPGGAAIVVGLANDEERAFVAAAAEGLRQRGLTVVAAINGLPSETKATIKNAIVRGQRIDVAVSSLGASTQTVLEPQGYGSPLVETMHVEAPKAYYWPTFLLAGNLMNIVEQVSIIAIVAIGMTMVIISGGIDLSVGSIMALASVIVAALILKLGGSGWIQTINMWLACLLTIAVCGLIGMFNGVMVTRFRVPPFIVTLSLMMGGSGLAYIISEISDSDPGYNLPVPTQFMMLGHGRLLGVPLTVLLMLVLYGIAHVVLSRTVFGRHLYAVGGNDQAAHLSGIRIARVRTIAYVICAALAGLGGIIPTSIFSAGDPRTGAQYELMVISAVVVGGTSLSGGEGKIANTLIGSLIIAVIRNAMNLAQLTDKKQMVVLGAVILGAVLFDRLKRGKQT
jgi:ribose transport system permease protein